MKFTIMQKLLAVIALPIIVLLIFSSTYINDKYSLLTTAQLKLSHLKIVDNATNLIYEIQLERGISTNYFNKKRPNDLLDTLKMQRLNSDKRILELQKNLNLLDETSTATNTIRYVNAIHKSLVKIKEIRTQINTHMISEKSSFKYYSTLNDLLISIINGLELHASSQDTNSYILILHKVIKLQEYAGQERALVSRLLNLQKITNKDLYLYHFITSYQKEESLSINTLLEESNLEDVLKDIHKKYSNNFFGYIREEFKRSSIQSHGDLSVKEWWIISSARIDEIHQLSDKLFAKIENSISLEIQTNQNLLKYQIILTFLMIFITLLSTFYIANKIKFSIKRLEDGINDFFDFLNFKRKKPENINTHSNDEINNMAQNINKQMSVIEDNIEEDQYFIQEIMQIVTLMKNGDFNESLRFEPNNPSLVELKEVFNELIELINSKIKAQTNSLEKLNSSLKDRVYEQTIELENQIREITDARDNAIQAEVAKDEFLANMSHEIRTPLNAILGFVTILQKRTTEEKSLKYLSIIDNSGKSLLTIINDILDFSKIQSGKFTITPYEVEPVEEFSNACSLFASKADEKHIIYAVYIDPNLPQTIKVDSVRVKQVLSNILSNSIKFTREDGEIKVNVTIENSQLIISVEDSGIGISKENISKVFSAFEQADGSTTRKYGGTGLGLSISSQLTSLMNGTLSVSSELGVGSVFTLKIPVEIINNSPRMLIEKKKMASYTFAILNNYETTLTQVKLIKKYLMSLGAENIIELQEYSDQDYDILFFIPDEDHNEEIVDTSKASIAMLRSSSIKLASLPHIQPLYIPFTPKAVVEAINGTNLKDFDLLDFKKAQQEDEEPQYEGFILIAEDNKTNQMLISLLMDDYEVNYKIANNGLEVVEMFQQGKYDLVLMDENMPELNGIAAMKLIKTYEKENNLTKTPIIALTASVLDTDIENFLKEGMDGFVGKPINTKELESELNKYLKRV